MMHISLFLLSLSLLFISVDAVFPTVDFTGLLQKYATTTDGTWCSKCAAFGNPPCALGCAGDPGGGSCPPNACPRVYTFPIVAGQPIWNIQVATVGDPYRAFSYIPLCTQASQCTESFFFSFSFKYTPGPNAAQSNFFSATRDYLKLLFWGDGNNILAVKNGQLLGLPNGGKEDLVGSNNIGTGNAFAIPFNKDTWYHIGIQFNLQFNVQNGPRTSLAFFINGVATGSTTGSIGIKQDSGLQFGAYVWNGAFFTLQYKDIAITKNLPNVATGTTTTAPPVTAKPTTAPTAKVTSAPTLIVTAKPTVPITSTTTIPPTDPTETTTPIDDTITPPPSVVFDPPLDDTTDPPAVTTRPPTPRPNMPIYNPATVALHNKVTDCWTILDGIVYDISKLVLIHPGGPAIRSYCGIDCSTIFSASHQNEAADRALLAKSYLKGTLGSITTSKPTTPGITNFVSQSNHATTITSDALCFVTSLVVAAVLEYLL